MPERYRVRLPDGQVFDKHATPAAIRKAHPEGRIVGRIVMDEVGQGRVVPYGGEQPTVSEAVAETQSGTNVAREPAAADTTSETKRASKKSG